MSEKLDEYEDDNESDQSGSEPVQPDLREESTEVKARILLSRYGERNELLRCRMSYSRRIASLRSIPVSGMAKRAKAGEFILAQRFQAFARFRADRAHVGFEAGTREDCH